MASVFALWDQLLPASEDTTLRKLAEEGLKQRRQVTIGVDTSLWLTHVQIVAPLPYPDIQAQVFYEKIAKFYNYGFRLVFVFDGPSRPRFKRNKNVSGMPLAYEHLAKKIISAFGFEWIRAPGEAEAELARLNAVGEVDWICTDDVDTFIFGGLNVLRNHSLKLTGNQAIARKRRQVLSQGTKKAKSKDSDDDSDSGLGDVPEEEEEEEGSVTLPQASDTPVTVFRMENITSKTGLDRQGMLLIALLSGADYDTTGVERCGVIIAAAMARCGFGKMLVSGYLNPDLDNPSLLVFVSEWRKLLQLELATNSKGEMGRKENALAHRVTEAFPNLGLLDMYLHPVTSANDDRSHTEISQPARPLNVEELINIFYDRFEWPHRRMLLRFFKGLLGGILYQMVRAEQNLTPHYNPFPNVSLRDLDLVVSKWKCDASSTPIYCRVQVNAPETLMDLIKSKLPERDHAPLMAEDKPPVKNDVLQQPWRDWLHMCILETAFKKEIRSYSKKLEDKAAKQLAKEERAALKYQASSESPAGKGKGKKQSGRDCDLDDVVQSRLSYIVGKPRQTTGKPFTSGTSETVGSVPISKPKKKAKAPLTYDDIFSSPDKGPLGRQRPLEAPLPVPASRVKAIAQGSSVQMAITLDSSPVVALPKDAPAKRVPVGKKSPNMSPSRCKFVRTSSVEDFKRPYHSSPKKKQRSNSSQAPRWASKTQQVHLSLDLSSEDEGDLPPAPRFKMAPAKKKAREVIEIDDSD